MNPRTGWKVKLEGIWCMDVSLRMRRRGGVWHIVMRCEPHQLVVTAYVCPHQSQDMGRRVGKSGQVSDVSCSPMNLICSLPAIESVRTCGQIKLGYKET